MDEKEKSKVEEERLRIIKYAEDAEEFVREVDGFIYYYPHNDTGILTSTHLRWIADELDERNREWDSQINKYFDGEK